MDGLPHIVLLTVDALRGDHCSRLGYERETTPGLDAFAEEAVEFRECVSVSSHTREAMPPLLSGYRPARFAANGFRAIDEPLLAERLADVGYATGGFHSNPYLSRAYGFGRGFDEFYDDLLLGRNRFFALAQRALEKFVFKRGEYYARADEINQRSLNWLDSVDDDQPVFLWNHYMDAHGPYHAPERHWAEESLSASAAESLYRRSWKSPEGITDYEQQLLLDSYDDELRWLDGQLQWFFDELRSRDLLENSLVILTADHGDAFGEHGYYTHPRYLHESLLHVPLIVSQPGKPIEGTVTTPVSTLDIVPTVLEYVNVSGGNLPGMPLIADTDAPIRGEDDFVFASATGEDDDEGIRRFAARDKRWKAMLEREINSGDVIEERVFDLRNDPEEQEGLSQMTVDAENILEQLREFSASRLNTVADQSRDKANQEQSAEIEERLEALGYK